MAVLKKRIASDAARLSSDELASSESVRAYARGLAQLEIPRELALILIAIGLFVLVALAISGLTGAPFVVPTEKASPAVGGHFMLPILLTAGFYLIVHAAAWALRLNPVPIGTLVRNAAYDHLMLALFVLVMLVHFHIKMWMPIIHPHMYDSTYLTLDDDLRGVVATFTAMRNAVSHLLPGTDLLYEGAFFAAFVTSFIAHSLGSRRWLHHNLAGVLLVEMIGPLTYLIAPAVGPFVYEHGPNAIASTVQLTMYQTFQHVQSGGVAWVAAHGGDYITQALAAMPSLHVSAALVMSYYAYRARLRIRPLFYIVLGWIVIESVASRWHYLIDIPAGALVGVLVILLVNRMYHSAVDKDGVAA